MKVAINGGHYDDLDSGAVGESGLHEANVTYRLMGLVSYYLQQIDIETLQIYENELYDVTSASNNWGADLFVSIHCNSAGDSSAHGTEIFTTVGANNSDIFATAVMNQISTTFPELTVRADYVDGDVDKESNFYVLRNTDCPAVLVETAFISNPDEEAILSDDSKLDEFAKAIARGVTDYAGTI